MSFKKNKKKSKKKQKKEWLWWKKFKAKWIWGFIILLLVVLAGSIIVFPQHQAHSTFFEYLNIFFSWPFVILILSLVLLLKYPDPISYRIRQSFFKKGDIVLGVQPQRETKPLEEKELEEIRGRLAEEKEVKEAIFKLVDFERMLRYMYRSQLNLLRVLVSYVKGFPKALIENTAYKGQYLKLGGNPNYSFDAYLGWLIHFAKFVKEEKINGEVHIKLTEDGQFFVDYVNRMNYSQFELVAGP